MNGASTVARILKLEGVRDVPCFPINPVMEGLAVEGIRPVVTRQERVAGNMADGMSRMSNGRQVGVFLVQQSAGAENAFAGVAQACTDSSPILFIPGHPGRHQIGVPPNFDSVRQYRGITKFAATVQSAGAIPDRMRQAYTALRTGRPGPALVELPDDVAGESFAGELDYTPPPRIRVGPDPDAVRDAARLLIGARRPLILAGQGVLYSEAWDELRELAELAAIPVTTSLMGKSVFPENHALALGPVEEHTATLQARRFLNAADVILAVGTSLSRTHFSPKITGAKRFIHVTIDARDLNKDYVARIPIISDAKLFLAELIDQVKRQDGSRPAEASQTVASQIRQIKESWLALYSPKRGSDEVPMNPYRVIDEFRRAVDPAGTVVTHESGGPRDQLAPFYESVTPRGYLGWGHSSQLGFSLGLAMGAKLVAPEKLVVNFMGDGSIGMVGMDLETAARAQIPILTIVLNNGLFGNYERYLPIAEKKHQIKKLTGHYADLATALGVRGRRVERPEQIAPALQEAIAHVRAGGPALLEMMTCEEAMSPIHEDSEMVGPAI